MREDENGDDEDDEPVTGKSERDKVKSEVNSIDKVMQIEKSDL